MPEGSSSDAPVMRPGPRALPRRFTEFFSARSSAVLGSRGRSGCTRGSLVVVGAFGSVKSQDLRSTRALENESIMAVTRETRRDPARHAEVRVPILAAEVRSGLGSTELAMTHR
jgi:hypothetical protein